MSFASDDAKINLKDINDEPLATVSPPWILSEPTVDLSLSIFLKDQTSVERYKQLYLELCQKHPNSIKIFTDGSKSGNHVASAAVIGPNFKKYVQKRILDGCSIFAAELHGILLALDLALTTNNDSFLIISDSLSALKILHSRKITHHILADIHDKHTYLIRSEMKNIIFVWVPSHVGIRGNEVVCCYQFPCIPCKQFLLVISIAKLKTTFRYCGKKGGLNKLIISYFVSCLYLMLQDFLQRSEEKM